MSALVDRYWTHYGSKKASDETHRVDLCVNRDALCRNSPAAMVRSEVQRRIVGGSGKAEKGQGTLRPMAP
jgi:hypothetical protein